MDMAKLTSKGQITIPIDVRRKLGLKKGDKVIFIEKGQDIVIKNASLQTFFDAKEEFRGEAERLGLMTEEDVVNMIKEIRKGK